MNQKVCLTLLTLCGLYLSVAHAQTEQKGPVKKTIDVADQAAIKGVDRLDKISHGVELRVEKLVHPEPHQGGQKNIASSALGGFGRLLRNVSVEGAKFAGTVGVGALKFSKGSAKAVHQSLKESAKRIVSPRRKQKPQPASAPEVVVIEPSAAPVTPVQPVPVATAELANADANANVAAPATPVVPEATQQAAPASDAPVASQTQAAETPAPNSKEAQEAVAAPEASAATAENSTQAPAAAAAAAPAPPAAA